MKQNKERDAIKEAFDPKSPKIIIKGNNLTIKQGDKEETFSDPSISREQLIYIALGGTKEQWEEDKKKEQDEKRQSELRREMAPWKRFLAEGEMLKMFPDSPVWELIRECATIIHCGEGKPINNERRNMWWCCPVGWRDQFEMIVVFHRMREGFFKDPNDLPHKIDYWTCELQKNLS